MRVALYQHSKFRDQALHEEMQQDPITQAVMAAVSQVPQKNRESAMKILTTLAKSEGVDRIRTPSSFPKKTPSKTKRETR